MTGTLADAGRRIRTFVLDALFPRRCAGCGREGTVWCRACADAFAPAPPPAACPFCGTEGSDRACAACVRTHALDGLTALFAYADPRVRRMLTGWKYQGDAAYAGVISGWIGGRLSAGRVPGFLSISTPVPLHASRLRSRGFNQAETVSRAAAASLGLPHADLLARVRKTAPQAKIAHAQRRAADLSGAFEFIPPLSKGRPGGVAAPERVLLCDDVFTTGATMDAAAAALKAAGAGEVWGFAVAKG